MLIFPLKKEWYEKIRSGEKKIEYREVKPYWTKRFYSELSKKFNARFFPFKFCDYESFCKYESVCEEESKLVGILRLGYTKRHMTADITKIEIVDGRNTDLHIDKPVYAIHLANVRECE